MCKDKTNTPENTNTPNQLVNKGATLFREINQMQGNASRNWVLEKLAGCLIADENDDALNDLFYTRDQLRESNNDGEGPFKSPYTGKRFSPVKVLEKIQQELRSNQYNSTGVTTDEREIFDLRDEISRNVANLSLIIDGLSNLCQNAGLGEYLSDDKMYAIMKSFDDLKELIEIRENEHDYIFKLAMHGEAEPFEQEVN